MAAPTRGLRPDRPKRNAALMTPGLLVLLVVLLTVEVVAVQVVMQVAVQVQAALVCP